MRKALQLFSIMTVIGMFLVLLAGALVTNTGSQDGCGNTWPLCYGEFRPIASLASLIEYSHRLVTGIVGLMVGALSIWTWRAFPDRTDIKWIASFSIFFLLLQSGLGAGAVIWSQSDAVLALHFGISLLSFASVVLLSVLTFQLGHDEGNLFNVSTFYRNSVWAIFIYVYGLVYLGALLRRVNGGLAIHTWPLNNNKLIPDNLFSVIGVNFAHRIAALIGLLLIIWLFLFTRRYYRHQRGVYVASMLTLVTIALQVLSGGYVVLSKLSVTSLMIHATFVSIFFAALSYLLYASIIGSSRT